MKPRVCPNCGPVKTFEFDPLEPCPQTETCVACGTEVDVR